MTVRIEAMVTSIRHATVSSYSAIAISLHWAIALLMICGYYLGWIMTDIPGLTPSKLRYFSWHKWIAVTVPGTS